MTKKRLPGPPRFFTACLCMAVLVSCSIFSGCTAPNSQSSAQPLTGKGISVTDSIGNVITLPEVPSRIICQNTRVVELFIVVGAGDQLVGVTDQTINNALFKKHLPNAQSIGNWQTPSTEKIFSLKPDLFVSYITSKPKNTDQLIKANITVMYIDAYILPKLPDDARKIGIITGNEEKAEAYARFIERYLSLIQSRLNDLPATSEKKVYAELYSDYSAQGRGTQGDAVITLLHAKNIAGNLTAQSLIVSPEWVLDQDPDVIIKFASSPQSGNPALSTVYEKILARPGFERLSAVRNHRVFVLSGDAVSTPRGIAGALYLAKALYPDKFSDIDPQSVLHEYAEQFLPGSDQIDTFYPPLSASGSGSRNTTEGG
ncbi:MAG: ABC transporter substrate-binding protein [Methanoregula sp.]|nr:ABC transporter substrate-binding protein [Methanoregula sp.]